MLRGLVVVKNVTSMYYDVTQCTVPFRLFRQIATAVYYCHIHKICHRDLKLENVLLDDTGSAKVRNFIIFF